MTENNTPKKKRAGLNDNVRAQFTAGSRIVRILGEFDAKARERILATVLEHKFSDAAPVVDDRTAELPFNTDSV